MPALTASPDIDGSPDEAAVARPRAAARISRFADYQTLCKVRLNAMVLISAAVGFFMAAVPRFNWHAFLHLMVGTALTAWGSGVLNQWIEIDLDARMPRTANRPLPAGRISPREGLVLGITLSLAGLVYLATFANVPAFVLGAATLLIYLFVYTPLKTRSTLNTVVGAIPGAFPPLMGYAAAAGHLGWNAWVLFALMFLWQMPHFLAIATMYRDDYRAGGYKMLPVLDADLTDTARQSVLYLGALMITSLMPTVFHMTGLAYTAIALLAGAGFLATGLIFALHRTRRDARRMFFASITYLPIVLIAMVLDRT